MKRNIRFQIKLFRYDQNQERVEAVYLIPGGKYKVMKFLKEQVKQIRESAMIWDNAAYSKKWLTYNEFIEQYIKNNHNTEEPAQANDKKQEIIDYKYEGPVI